MVRHSHVSEQCLDPIRLLLSRRPTGQKVSQMVRMAAQVGGAAAETARRDNGSAELDQLSSARRQGAGQQNDRQSPLDDAASPTTPATVSLQPSVSTHSPSPAGNSSIAASDAVTPVGFSAQQQQSQQPSLVVFSGGTAFNTVAGGQHQLQHICRRTTVPSSGCMSGASSTCCPDALRSIVTPYVGHMRTLTTHVTHVLPVSDDGGSTAEIVRVLGGPAVGDIRSRCLRLADDSNEEVGTTSSMRVNQRFWHAATKSLDLAAQGVELQHGNAHVAAAASMKTVEDGAPYLMATGAGGEAAAGAQAGQQGFSGGAAGVARPGGGAARAVGGGVRPLQAHHPRLPGPLPLRHPAPLLRALQLPERQHWCGA
jgi:2-phospho-L-lactate transferase CofD